MRKVATVELLLSWRDLAISSIEVDDIGLITCSRPDLVAVRGAECLFLKLTTANVSMLVITAVQTV